MEVSSTSLRVTLVQTQIHWENPMSNCAELEERLNSFVNQTDVVVLPEMFTTGFSINSIGAELMNGPSIKWLQLMSNRLNALFIGSLKIKESGGFFNRLVAAYPTGEILFYDKKHLFRMGEEGNVYKAGNKRQIIQFKGFSIALFVCYDLRFPVWIRNRQNEYDLAVFVANWPAARANAWQTLLRARAIENLSYVAGVNIIGQDGNQITYQGDSAVIDFKGNPIVDLGDQSAIQTVEINKENLDVFRKIFPAFLDADSFDLK
jgi:predicted amidohydrolase